MRCCAQAFHLSSGIDAHIKFRVRKALRLWVSRAHIRRGLRKQVFVSALKGKEVLRLMQMADAADTDDLCNAIIAKDAEGCTPLVCAAVRDRHPPSPLREGDAAIRHTSLRAAMPSQ